MQPDENAIAQTISRAIGESFQIREQRRLTGGDINQALLVGDGNRRYFVKFNRGGLAHMLDAEADALGELASCQALRVPRPVCRGDTDDHVFLVLDYIELHAPNDDEQRALGRGMAALHGISAERFGWHRDNTIGVTPQQNRWCDDWPTFWLENRLKPQLRLAADRPGGRAVVEVGERVMERLPVLLAGHHPLPSLLHGDLWAGNAAADAAGRPVIFDPATYYGDRETDLAMMSLFGGFGEALSVYQAQWPLPDGYFDIRRPLYQAYHLLNHFNLFGGRYADSARRVMQRVLGAT